MLVHLLTNTDSIVQEYLNELRDTEIQKDQMRFRYNLKRLGFIMGYEISKKMTFDDLSVRTPFGISNGKKLKSNPVLATIFRAGLPMHEGLLDAFDHAESAFVSAYRKHRNLEEFSIEIEYLNSPLLDGKTLIIADTMIATGYSMYNVYKALLKQGKPAKVYIITAIASKDGVEYLKGKLPDNAELFAAAIDEELTAQSYIVPGLGDAGDLCYGEKN